MSVLLTSATYINGVLTASGTTVSLGYIPEYNLVYEGSATWVSIPSVVPNTEQNQALSIAPVSYMLSSMLRPAFAGSVTSKTVFTTAVNANAAKVAYVGHSIANGGNQNYYGATVYNMLRNSLKEAFPNVTFTFEDYGIGGTKAADFLGNPNVTIAAPSATTYREYWQLDSGAINTTAAWANKVAAFAPDLIVMQWDLNETDPNAFATAVQSNIDDINGNARWTKRPSIVLVSSHVGKTNGAITQTIIRACHQALRALAKKNKVALVDAGRIYDILTTGIDPRNIFPVVSGEIGFGGRVTAAANLPAAYYDAKINNPYSPTGTTIRSNPSGNPLRFYRSRLCADGAIQGQCTNGSSSGTISVLYRADPTDINYATGTGSQYEARIYDNGTNTFLQMYYWSAGVATAISGATVTLTNRLGTNTQYQIRAEFKGCNHKVTVYAPNAEIKTLEFVDYSSVVSGYSGWDVGGTGGGFWTVGTTGNASAGDVIEFWDKPTSTFTVFSDTDMVGAINDWTTNPLSLGGNAVNHLTNASYKAVYENAFYDVIRQLQA
jgi:hypothetical protein